MANNDLNVTMGLDESELTRGLVRAQDAIQQFTTNSRRVIELFRTSLNAGTKDVNNLGTEVQKLGAKLLAAFSLNALKETAEWANSLVQTSKAVGMTTGQLLSFQNAVMQAGGSSRAASLGIEMFYMKLDQARQGGLAQQVAFQRLGITLTDLKNLDDRTLFEKTIRALAELPPSAERNRLEVELFSKSFRGIPLQEIAEQLDKTRGKFDDFGPVLADAGKAYQQLQIDLNNFKIALLEVVQPIMQAFAGIKPGVEDFQKALVFLIDAVVLFLSYQLATKVILITEAFFAAVPAIKAVIVSLEALSVAEGIATLGIGTILQFLAKLGVVAAAAVGGVTVIEKLNEALDKNATSNRTAAEEERRKTDQDSEAARKSNQVYTEYAKMNAAIVAQTQAFKDNIQAQITSITLKDAMFGNPQAYQKAFEEELRVRQEYRKKLEELNVKLQEAQEAKPENPVFYTQEALKKSIADLTAQRDRDIDSITAATIAQVKQNETNQAKIDIVKDIVRQQKELTDIQNNIDNITATSDQRKLLAIQAQTRALVDQATEKRRTELGGLDPGDEQLQQDKMLKIITDGIRRRQEAVQEATVKEIEASRDFATGWESAYKQYVENATNAASASRSVFETATKGMEDAFVNFAKTGKLSFADMAASILEDILRIQIRMIASNIMGQDNNSGLSSIFGGVKKLLGFAQGGVVPGNAPIIVGENGPELFTPAGGGTITPNNQLSAGTNVVYNINAVDAMSFKNMLAQDPTFLYALTLQGKKSLPGVA